MRGDEVERYVRQVMKRLPRTLPARSRIEADLRLHLSDLVAEERSMAAVVERMGPPEQVAADFLGQVPLAPAPHGRRFLAFGVDLALVAALLVPPSLAAVPWLRGLPLDTVITLATVGGGLGMFLYYVVPEAIFGRTLGKTLAGICVVREDGSSVGWWPALLRRIPFIGNFFPIDALFVLFTERRQRAFDKVAGTLVIRRLPSVSPPYAVNRR
jgi:uncharacterized RDD family membrane protein YckC